MVEKGKKNKNRREDHKIGKLSLKEKRKKKKDKKAAGDVFQKIKKTGTEN